MHQHCHWQAVMRLIANVFLHTVMTDALALTVAKIREHNEQGFISTSGCLKTEGVIQFGIF
jgi:hypothetical protein